MTLTPRKEERAAIVELLDADFESADALAGAVLKRAFSLFQDRVLWALVVGNGEGGRHALVGVFATETAADRAAAKSPFKYARAFPLWEIGQLAPPPPPSTEPTCRTCKHPKGPHDHVKGNGWCWAVGGSRKDGNRCGCKEFAPN